MKLKKKKDSTKSENIICRLLGQGKPLENSAVHWGIKHEPIAKKVHSLHEIEEKTRMSLLKIWGWFCIHIALT